MKKILDYCHDLLARFIAPDDIAVDMTAGNGHDTLFLAGISKFVYSFDIQSQAINNTNKLLQEHNISNVQLIQNSHELIDQYITSPIGGAVFNLGYLPGSDKQITTTSKTTINAINKLLPLLKKDGICVIVVYPGHQEGKLESEEVLKYAKQLPQQDFKVLLYQFINLKNNPPYILAIQNKKG